MRYYAREQVGVLDGAVQPPLLADGQLINAKERRVRATINFADRQLAIGDDVILGKRPRNSYYMGHRIIASVSLGATTLALGAVGAGNAAKYRAAAVFTTIDAPVAVATAAAVAADKLATDELQLATFGAAAAPAAGLLVIETIYTYD